MEKNMREWLRDVIGSDKKLAMPILSFPCISLLGVSVSELTRDAELQARGMKQVADRTPALAAVSMMDLSVEAEAFGAQTVFLPDEVPTVSGVLVRSLEGAEALRIPEVAAGRTGVYVDAIAKACKQITDRPVLAGVIGPFSLAGRLMGVSDVMVMCYEEPELVHAVLEKVTAFQIKYMQAFREVGANGVVIAEPLAGLLSPGLNQEFSIPYVKQMVDSTKSDDFLVIYHNCGDNAPRMLADIFSTGCDGYHFGDAITLAEVVGQTPRDCLVMGNISPSAQFLAGTPGSIREETLKLLAQCAPGNPNFIISSGCDIPPKTPWENIDAFFDAVTAYYSEAN